MKLHRAYLLTVAIPCVAAFLLPGSHCCAQSIPEPSLVMYGVVRFAGVRVTAGTLVWQITNNARVVTVSAPLTNINDQFSYVVQVPCETQIGTFQVSSNTLSLRSTPTAYNRSQVIIQTSVTNYSSITFDDPGQMDFAITSTDRGRLERVDLQIADSAIDRDGNGIPDFWEEQYFGFYGVDPNDDPDLDGLTNIQEYKAGTDPLDPNSRFMIHIVSTAGLRIEWESTYGTFYHLQRSSHLLTGFTNVATQIAATPPKNTWQDTNAVGAGPYFYRLQIAE